MKEGKPDELFAAWLTLPEAQRHVMDAEFRDIFDMSCEKGFRAIIDEAEFRLDEDEFTAWVEKQRPDCNGCSWIDLDAKKATIIVTIEFYGFVCSSEYLMVGGTGIEPVASTV